MKSRFMCLDAGAPVRSPVGAPPLLRESPMQPAAMLPDFCCVLCAIPVLIAFLFNNPCLARLDLVFVALCKASKKYLAITNNALIYRRLCLLACCMQKHFCCENDVFCCTTLCGVNKNGLILREYQAIGEI